MYILHKLLDAIRSVIVCLLSYACKIDKKYNDLGIIYGSNNVLISEHYLSYFYLVLKLVYKQSRWNQISASIRTFVAASRPLKVNNKD